MKCKLCNKPSKKSLCTKHLVQVRRYRFKIAAMMYLGGKCTRCGNDDISVLEFHHKKDSNKKFDIGGKINKSWYIIKKEIDKCILLCANCHLKEHRQNLTPEFLEVMFDYHGTTKINEVAELLHTYESKLSVPHKDMR